MCNFSRYYVKCDVHVSYMSNVSLFFFFSSIVWRSDCGHRTREHVYILLEGKDPVPDDIVDVLVLMLREELLTNPLAFKKRAVVTRPLALSLQKSESAAEQAVYMMEDIMFCYKNADVILMPIIFNGGMFMCI